MKIIIVRVLLGLLALFVLANIAGLLFGKSKMELERSLVIKAPRPVVFELVNTLKNWELWSPWHKLDPKMKLSYSGPAAGDGAMYEWQSEQSNVGNGKMTVLKSAPFDSIKTMMDFKENGMGYAGYYFKEVPEGVEVRWTLNSDMGNFPLIWLFTGTISDMVGKDYERGLANMAHVADSVKQLAPAAATYQVTEQSLPARQALGVSLKCTMDKIGEQLGMAYGSIGKLMKEQSLKMAGPPAAVYYNDGSNGTFDFMAIMVYSGGKAKAMNSVKAVELPATKVAVVDFYGPYEQTGKAHEFLAKWMAENGKTQNGAPWEEYLTDPMVEKDPNKVLTKVYYPIK